jgi:5-methylcytosine-specific restriction protein A
MPAKLPSLLPKKTRPADGRPSPSKRGYDWNWRKVRAAKLASDPLCEDCSQHGLVVVATEVDHVDGNVRNLAADNLRSLCKPCHSSKTVMQDGGLGLLPARRHHHGVDCFCVDCLGSRGRSSNR